MLSPQKINSIETLRLYLEANPSASSDVVVLVQTLVDLVEQISDIPSRDFLLGAATCWPAQHLNLSGKEFIAKRIFAFWRKRKFDLLTDKLHQVALTPPPYSFSDAMELLAFEGSPSESSLTLASEGSSIDHIEMFSVSEESGEPTPILINAYEDSDSFMIDPSPLIISAQDESHSLLAEEVSDQLPAEEISDLSPVEEIDALLTIEEASDLFVQEISSQLNVEEISDQLHVEEISDQLHVEETSDLLYAQETSDHLYADEISPLPAEEITSDEIQLGTDSESVALEINEALDLDESDRFEMSEFDFVPVDVAENFTIVDDPDLDFDFDDLEGQETEKRPLENQASQLLTDSFFDIADLPEIESSEPYAEDEEEEDQTFYSSDPIGEAAEKELEPEKKSPPKTAKENPDWDVRPEETFFSVRGVDLPTIQEPASQKPDVSKEKTPPRTPPVLEEFDPEETFFSAKGAEPKKKPAPLKPERDVSKILQDPGETFFSSSPSPWAKKTPAKPKSTDSVPSPIIAKRAINKKEEAKSLRARRATTPASINLARIAPKKQEDLKQAWDRLKNAEIKKITGKAPYDLLLERLEKGSLSQFIRIVQGVCDSTKSTQDKYPLMRLKYVLVQYEGILTSSASILALINYGEKKGQSVLKKFSQVMKKRAINKYVYNYFTKVVEAKLQEHHQVFRKGVERAKSREELLALLADYPIYDSGYLNKFSSLQIIAQVKRMSEKQYPKKLLDKLLEKELGTSEANIKMHLARILVQQGAHSKLEEALFPHRKINHILTALKEMKDDPETGRVATTIFQLIVTFIKGKQKLSFQSLQSSLSMIPTGLQQHILKSVRFKLQKDLEKKVAKILQEKGYASHGWQKLHVLLTNPQIQSTGIKLFGYTLEELLEKLKQVSIAKDNIPKVVANLFTKESFPESMKDLIIKRHISRSISTDKNLYTCQKELSELAEKKLVSLKQPLTNLFQAHGQVNFSGSEEQVVDGYQIARAISKYYQNPSRTKIELPSGLTPELDNLLSETVNQERLRQLSKLEKKNEES